ncbi:MAG TPA: hypothetical protein VF079_09670 [Sphingomicrobium sp.]
MSRRKSREKGPEEDAAVIEQKFGDFADVYAQSRIEAAEIAGDEPRKDHWEEVDARLDDEDDQ